MRARRGFTLLEVMVAVAILGLGLTAILSAQAGAFATSKQARSISVATGLARCKMSELEEHLARDGFQELDETDNGPCCEGDETPNVRCSWKIEKPEFPPPKFGELDLDTDIGSSQMGPLGALQDVESGKTSFSGDAGVGEIAQTLAGGGDPSVAGMAGGMTQMAMELVYPDLKSLFEASSRRVTVTITWTEGIKEYGFDLVQWYTSPQEGGIVAGAEDEAAEDEPSNTRSTTGSGTTR
jgi:general secretion pathway protein I